MLADWDQSLIILTADRPFSNNLVVDTYILLVGGRVCNISEDHSNTDVIEGMMIATKFIHASRAKSGTCSALGIFGAI